MPITLVIQLLFIYLILCGVAAFLGRRRRIGFWGFFFLSVLVTPFLTAMFVFVAAPVKKKRPVAQKRP